MIRNDRQYLRKKGPERVILFGSKSFHVYVCFANARFCDAMFLIKKKKCAGHTYYSAVSPPSEFYNILIDGSRVKCLICSNIIGELDSKIDSIVLDIEKIRLVRIEPRNLTAVCTSKDSDHGHEMLVSSAYCDTVYKSYTKPEFYSVSRYKTLKQPCELLPDKIPGFNFISSLSRSFRYIRVHRFRHPSSIRGIYNPLSLNNLQSHTSIEIDASAVLSDSSNTSIDSHQSNLNLNSQTMSGAASTISKAMKLSPETIAETMNHHQPSINTQISHKFSQRNDDVGGYHFPQVIQSYFNNDSNLETSRVASDSYGDFKNVSRSIEPRNMNACSPCSEHRPSHEDPHSAQSFTAINFTPKSQNCGKIGDFITNPSENDKSSASNVSLTQRHYNGYEIPNDFDMVHFN